MEVKITYRHMESTPSIEEKINDKSRKLKKYFAGKMHVEWVVSVEGDNHTSEVNVKGDHIEAHASASDDNLYKTFDEAIAKVDKQLSKQKEKLQGRLHRSKQ